MSPAFVGANGLVFRKLPLFWSPLSGGHDDLPLEVKASPRRSHNLLTSRKIGVSFQETTIVLGSSLRG